MQEIWKDVVGYEGLYQVSNKGNVKSLKRSIIARDGRYIREVDECMLRQRLSRKYKQVVLCKDSIYKFIRVHRLVAQAFIPNPENLPQVNHKDEDKFNNCVENLEWCTQLYNEQYGNKGKKTSEAVSKPVIQFGLDGSKIKQFDSQTQASKILGIRQTGISLCCVGRYKTSGGFKWKFT